jgi:autotransporter translocation and assembly factor TamB
MNPALRIIIRSSILLLLAFCALTLLLSAAVMMPPVQRSIKSAVEGLISQRLGNQVTIGAIHLNWIERVDLRDVVVVDREFGDAMTIHSLRVRLALLPLLKKRLEIKRVMVQGATVTGTRTKANGVHFPFIPKHLLKIKLWTVTIKSAVISGLSVRYNDSATGQYYSLTGIKSRLTFRRLDSLTGMLAAGGGEAITPWYSGRVKNIDIQGELSPRKLVVFKGVITGDSATVGCQGTIPFSSQIRWKTHADVTTFLSPLVCARKIAGLQPRGEVHAVASLSGLLDSPRINLQVAARKIVYDSISFETATAKIAYSPDAGLAGSLDCASPLGQAAVKVNAVIPRLFRKPDIEAWSAGVTADLPRIADLASRAGLKHPLLRGAAHIDVTLGGRGIAALPGHAIASFAIKRPAEPGVLARLSGTMTLDNREWRVDIAADSGNRLVAQGSIDERMTGIDGVYSFGIDNPAPLSRLFLPTPVAGSISGSGTLGGAVRQPEATIDLRVHDASWQGASIDRLSASAHYANRKLYINKASLQSSGELAALLPLMGIHNAGGRFHLTAEGYGPLENPSVSAEVGVAELHTPGFAGAALTASLAYRNDTLQWSGVRLGKSAAWLKSSGIACLAARRRFARGSIIAERSGYQSAVVTASGAATGDSIEGSVSVARMDPALLMPWIKAKFPIRGLLTLQAALHGTARDPVADAHLDFDQALGRSSTIRYRAEASLRNSLLEASMSACPLGRSESLLVSLSAPMTFTSPWTVDHLIRDNARITIDGSNYPLGDMMAQFLPQARVQGAVSLHTVIVKEHASWLVQGDLTGSNISINDSARAIRAGGLSANAAISGDPGRLSFTWAITGDSLSLRGSRFEKPLIRGHAGAGMLVLDTAGAGFSGGHLSFAGSVPWDQEHFKFNLSALSLHGVIAEVPLKSFGIFAPALDISGGTLNGDVAVTAGGNRPHFGGRFSVKGAGFKLKEYEPAFGPVDMELSLRNDSVIVESLRGDLGGVGKFSGEGYFEPGNLSHMQFSLSAADCRLKSQQLDAGIGSASAQLTDSANTLILGGHVTMADSRYSLYLSPAAMFQKAPPVKPKKAGSKNPLLSRAALRMVVDLDKNVTVDCNLGSLTLDGTVTVVGSPERPGIVGTITTTDGYVYYLDRKFTVQQGTFRFTNPNDINPEVNMIATDTVTSSSASGQSGAVVEQSYVVTLTVTDSLRKPTVVLTSDPPLQPELIVSLITLGTTQGVLGTDLSRRIEGLLAQQLAGFGQQKLQQLLNVESINVGQGNEGLSVTAIKRISPRLSVTYQAVLQTLGSPKVAATYRLLPNLYIIGSEYYQHTGGIDLHFRFSR